MDGKPGAFCTRERKQPGGAAGSVDAQSSEIPEGVHHQGCRYVNSPWNQCCSGGCHCRGGVNLTMNKHLSKTTFDTKGYNQTVQTTAVLDQLSLLFYVYISEMLLYMCVWFLELKRKNDFRRF